MKRTIKLFILLLAFPLSVLSQKDSIRLACPLNEAIIVPPSKAQDNAPSDLCVVVHSKMDTIVKAVTNGKVASVEENPDEKGKWDVVFYTKYKNVEYYFWYTGLSNVVVRRNQVVKEGQPLGYLNTGEKIELLMYDFETPVDPMKYLSCK